MKIVDAKFLQSAQSVNDSPAPNVAEVAFIGRSNVGKSSLLNTLTNRGGLAKSSSTPGKTQLINYFEIRPNLQIFVHLIDSRHPGLEIDNNVQEFLKEIKRGDQIIINAFTKTD